MCFEGKAYLRVCFTVQAEMMPFHSFPVILHLFLAKLAERVWRERAGLLLIITRVRLHMCVGRTKNTK